MKAEMSQCLGDHWKDSSLIRCYCFLTFIISANYGAKLDLSPLPHKSLCEPTDYDASKLLVQSPGKRKLATLIGSESGIPGRVNVDSELSITGLPKQEYGCSKG